MNPILLKSGGRRESDGAYLCSVIVMGKHYATEDYGALGKRTETLMDLVLEAHSSLAADSDLVVLEGAGSCTELNLMERDVVNLPLVRRLQCPWLLVANIDPGGVFAQIVGTKACLSDEDWGLCVGVIVNKLRGEAKYFEPGPSILESMVGKPLFVVPWLYDINIAEEDGMGLERKLANEQSAYEADTDKQRVAVVCYPHISMTDDLLPVEMDSRFQLEWRRKTLPKPYPHTTTVVLPGSRQTRSDLDWLLKSPWKAFIQEHVVKGGTVLGLCGGYQMLGRDIVDAVGVESGKPGTDLALGLLPVTTALESTADKVVRAQKATLQIDNTQVEVAGYEIHCGRTRLVNDESSALTSEIRPLLQLQDGHHDGFSNGQVHGTYLHGILQNSTARSFLLGGHVGAESAITDPLSRLASHLEASGLDFKTLSNLISQKSWP